MNRIGKHLSPRLLVAPIVVGVGLVAALAGSSSSAIDGGRSSRADLRRLASGAVVSAGVAADARPQITHGPVIRAVAFDRDLRKLPRARPIQREAREHELEPLPGVKETLPGAAQPVASPGPSAPAPDPTISFPGLDFATWGAGHPPDTVGDVGPTVFVQAVNTSIGIFKKSDGSLLAATTFDNLFTGTGTLCDTDNGGDPTVVYDPMSDRWIVGDFAFAGDGSTPPFYECIAVSKTGDPVAGGWWFYAIRTDDATHPWFADYPKMGIWLDGLYMTANMFSNNGFEEVRVWAFNRSDLESGSQNVRSVVVDLGTTAYFSLMPSNMRVATGVPPAGRDNILVSESESAFAWEVWKFHPDYSGGGTTFTFTPTNVSQTSYTRAPLTIPTPANSLDSLRERVMMQAQYTNLGGAESVWVNHTVRCCGPSSAAGIQWAQIDVTGGTVSTTPVQQQLYPAASDGLHRWMGSLAVDEMGDMALGYSVANGSTNPDIRYAARFAGDPPGTLPQAETSMLQGVARGSQSGKCGGNTCIRWGDYSAMSIDPDGCTFWYTQEYYETTGLDWQTRVGSFKLISKTCQRITFGSLPNKTFGDADFVVSATATSGLAVSFAASGGCTVSGSTVHITGAGSCKVTASQDGDATFNSALPVSQSFSIAQGVQSITFAPLAARTFGDADFPVSATASSGLPVAFAAAGGCTVSGTSVHVAGAGSCTVTASQTGDANYTAAPNVAQTFAVAKVGQAIAFGPLVDKKLGNPDFPVSATASSGLPVSFAATGSCTVSGTTVHLTGAGSCTVTASQAGDANHNAATNVSHSFTIVKPAPKCTVPKVVGKKLAAAKTALKRSHCALGKVSHAYSKKTKRGKVSAQSRRAGHVLPANAKVNLVVSRGRKA